MTAVDSVPLYISIGFGITTVLSLYIFYKASGGSKAFLLLVSSWMLLNGVLATRGFYMVTGVLPPRFLLLLGPPLFLIAFLFSTKWGRAFIDGLKASYLTLLHVIRIPVELVLFGLFLEGLIPELMTFDGRNMDILAGLTAIPVYYFTFVKKRVSKRLFLFWNIVSIVLLLNIIVHGILSAPSPFQQLAFEQPNVAVVQFPYVFLPGVIVPLVLFSHLALWRMLLKESKKRIYSSESSSFSGLPQ